MSFCCPVTPPGGGVAALPLASSSQRQDAPGTSRSLWLLVAGVVLLFLSIGAAGFAYQWSTGDPGAPADPTGHAGRPVPGGGGSFFMFF